MARLHAGLDRSALRGVIFAACALFVVTAQSSCTRRVAEEAPHATSKSDQAALFVAVRDVAGNPVEGCVVVIKNAHIGGMTDARGLTRIADVPPGTWYVTWHLIGYFPDSLAVHFDPGVEESLGVILREPEPERANPYEKR